MQIETSRSSTMKIKFAFLAALTTGLVSGGATPASAVMGPSGGGGGSFAATASSDTHPSLPAQIWRLEKD